MKNYAIISIELHYECCLHIKAKMLWNKPFLQYEIDNRKRTNLCDKICVSSVTPYLQHGIEKQERYNNKK